MSKEYDQYLEDHINGVIQSYYYLVNNDIVEYSEDLENQIMYAFLHHLHNNPHHWQYWVLIHDSDESHKEEVLDMPYNYVVEMVCDWWSFSWMEFWKTGEEEQLLGVFAWYDDNKHSMKLSNATRYEVEYLLDSLRQSLS